MTTRREFIKNTSLLATAAAFTPFSEIMAGLMKENKLGIQLFSIPKMLSEDFMAGIMMLQSQGYKELELFGPFPFSAEKAKKGWEAAGKCLVFREVAILVNRPKKLRKSLTTTV